MFDKKKITKFPTNPGVYLMQDQKGKVLYIGKAKNLRSRVKQYFSKSGDGRAMIPYLLAKVVAIETIVVQSEKEALLLENTLIKQHQPPYNALLKDDKSYICLHMTTQKKWPSVEIVRYRGKPSKKGRYFGPYSGIGAARQTFDLLNRIFPLRQCSDQEFSRRLRPCILYQMKRCIAPCVGRCSEKEYQRHVCQAMEFLEGKNTKVIKGLYQRMQQAAEELEFERAHDLLQLIRMIEKTVEKQQVERVGGVSADVIGIFREADQVTLSLLTYCDGQLRSAQDFYFSQVLEDDQELISSFILQYYSERERPALILVSSLPYQAADLEKLLQIKVHKPVRGEKKELVLLAEKNAQAQFAQKKDQDFLRQKVLVELKERLHLFSIPSCIECIDTSHFAGEEPVAAIVCYVDGKKEKKFYRRYKIKEAQGGDDYGAMREVLQRRFEKLEQRLPDLLIVDGGKGQLNVAKRVLEELDIIGVEVIGLAKEQSRHDKGLNREKVFVLGQKDPIKLAARSQLLFFLQRVRDEAHRFVLSFQQKRKRKKTFTSVLSTVPGIGPVKEKRLLERFGSVKELKKASVQAITMVEGISEENARKILDTLYP